MGKLSESQKYHLVIACSFLIMLLGGFLPTFGDMTPYGMKIFSIFIGCIFGWLCGVIIPVALLALVFAGFTVAGQSIDGLYTAVHSAKMVLVIFWALLFVHGLSNSGLIKFIANKILSNKWAVKSPWHLAVAFWICTFVCAGVSAEAFPVTILMYGMFYGVAEKLGIQKRSVYCTFVLSAIAAVSAISVCSAPYSVMFILVSSIAESVVPNFILNIPVVCFVSVCTVIGTIILASILLKIVLRKINLEFTMDNNAVITESVPFDKKVKWGLFFIILLVCILMLPTFLPADNVVSVFLNKTGSIGMFSVIVMLMTLVTVDGEKLLDIEKAIKHGAISWQLYFLLGTALAFSSILVSNEAGLALTLRHFFDGFVGDFSVYVIVLIMLALGLALTNCITNAVAMQLIIPVLATLVMAKGVNPAIFVGLAALVLDHGLFLPSGSPTGAFIHANTDWMDDKYVYMTTFCTSTCLIVSVALVGIPLAMTLGI